MTRREAMRALAVAGLLSAGGVTWLFGAVGMLCAGMALAVVALVVPTRKDQ